MSLADAHAFAFSLASTLMVSIVTHPININIRHSPALGRTPRRFL
ncbi:hypothetical protein BN961_00075 [Afipia felis]|uniref:Uncharacterized protein n=1 Tax=Afipia felis TaxID=1035 RepID=A0A090MG78_AFIFE|nr:hypothetical protein BN961_00075 [Afipia felis]